jgi:CubicO group peptidase (beta-lactamase class C family)
MRAFIVFLSLALLTACEGEAPGEKQLDRRSIRQIALAHRCDSVVRALVGGEYGASVLVSINDTVILNAGYGTIDSVHHVAPADTTLFNIASISKSFTAVCIAQLEVSGMLQRSDSLGRFLPELPGEKSAITIEQCLTHTSGLGQHYAADGKRSLEEAVHAIGQDTLDTIPGAAFRYSNENYELLAAVVERASGEPFDAYLRAHVLQPARLTRTMSWSDVPWPAPPAIARAKQPLGPEVFGTNWGYIGSGGLYSCARDLHAWFDAVRDGRLIPQALRDTLWSARVPLSVGHAARGWFVSNTKNTREVWTRGTEDWGHNAVVRWFPERGLLLIVLTNSGEIGDKGSTGNRLISDALLEFLIDP